MCYRFICCTFNIYCRLALASLVAAVGIFVALPTSIDPVAYRFAVDVVIVTSPDVFL